MRAAAMLVCVALGVAGVFCIRTLSPFRPRHPWVNAKATPRLLMFYWVLSWGLVIMAIYVLTLFATRSI